MQGHHAHQQRVLDREDHLATGQPVEAIGAAQRRESVSGPLQPEMEGVPADVAASAMRLAAHKLPIKTKFVTREQAE